MLRDLIQIWKSSNLMDQAWKESFEMLEITNSMFLEAVRILRESDDIEIKKEIREKDKIVNHYLRDVRRKVLTHCSLEGRKEGRELPSGLALISIVIDIERVGDYTKNVVDLVTYRPEKLNGGILEKNTRKIELAVKDNFKRTRSIIEKSDENAAAELLREYAWVSGMCDECIISLVQGKDKSLSPSDSASMALYMRYLKRINAHLRNVLTSIVNPFDRIGFNPKINK